MEEKQRRSFQILSEYRDLFMLCLTGMLIGLAVGLIEAVFGVGLRYIVDFHEMFGNILLLGLPLAGLLIVWIFQTWGAPASGGMSLLFDVDQKKRTKIPKRLIVVMIFSTWLTHLFGGSAGNEGVAVQVGATVSNALSRWLKFRESPSIFLICGMAAGFAGLFGTPFTAVFFALEVLTVGSIRYKALGPAALAAFTSSWISSLFGISKRAEQVEFSFQLDLKLTMKLILLGILFSIAGQLFSWGMKKARQLAEKRFPNPYKRIFLLSIVLALVLLFWGWGRYSSLSLAMLSACFNGGTVYWYDWIGKMVCTIFTLSIGFKGGEVAPLYTIGAALGCILGPMAGLSPAVGAMLGYAAVFGAGTNTYLASIMIGMEIFGYSYFPLFFVCCTVAYLLNRNHSIYARQQVVYR